MLQYFKLLPLGYHYTVHVLKQYSFMRNWLKPLVAKHCNSLNYTLSKLEAKKVLDYYPVYTVCANAENYIFLKNRKLTLIERKRLTLMASMATLCDDLIDEDGWNENQLLDLLDDKLDYENLSNKTKLIVLLNKEFKKLNVPEPYWTQLRRAFAAQADSIRQNNPDLTIEETLQISKDKNGNTSLLVASVINEEWTANELNLIYQTGVLGQLANDIYDAYKDVHDGIYTIVRKANNNAHLRQIFMTECERLYSYIDATHLTKKQKATLRTRLAAVNSFGLVGLDKLQEVENKHGVNPQWQSIPRKELITDMALWPSRFKFLDSIFFLQKL